jgi:hypothetical protein
VIAGVGGSIPYAGYAKFAASAFLIVIRAIDLAPCVAAAHLYAPTIFFGVIQGLLDFLFGVTRSSHPDLSSIDSELPVVK